MLFQKISKKKQFLSDEIKHQIIEMIRSGQFETNKLPAESKLARQFGVSINVVREALLLLREDGIVTKKHGSGNYFHRSALDVSSRLDRTPDFGDLLRESGYSPFQPPLEFQRILPEQRIMDLLGLKRGEYALYYSSIIYADSNPAIYSESWFPEKHYKETPLGEKLHLDFFEYIAQYSRMELAYGWLEYIGQCATELEERTLHIPVGSPLITMEEVFYSLEDIPLVFSKNQFNRKYVRAHMFVK